MALPVRKIVKGFRTPIVAAETPRVESPDVSFADLVRMMGEGIADAQAALDKASAEVAVELAATEVDIVPTITETIAKDGTVTFERGTPQKRSLLEIGISPTFYQFREATVEVTMDMRIVETGDETTKEKRKGLFSSTRDVTLDRRFSRDVKATSKVTTTLVPVPSPIRVEPVRTTVIKE